MEVGVVLINYTCVADLFPIGSARLRIDNRLTERGENLLSPTPLDFLRENKNTKVIKAKDLNPSVAASARLAAILEFKFSGIHLDSRVTGLSIRDERQIVLQTDLGTERLLKTSPMLFKV